MSFFAELKRRNVVRVGFAYAVAAWLLIQVTDIVFPRIGLPDSAVTLVIALLGIGFVPALIFAWAFEMTPEGIKREHEVDRSESITHQTGKRLDRWIIAALGLVVAWFLFDEFYLETRGPDADRGQLVVAEPAETQAPAPSSAGSKSVAVLPFRAMSNGEDDEYFADGLTEEILNSLTALPELLVTARTSSFHFKGQDLPIPEIAATLGVDHVVEGSVRRSGDTARITAQLIRAEDGFHLWSDTYDRTLEDVFAVQEEIAASIAETLDVVLDSDKREQMRAAGIGDVEAFIAAQKGMDAYAHAHTTEEPFLVLPEANAWFDKALERVPDVPYILYARTDLYGHLLVQYAGLALERPPEDAEAAVAEIRTTLGRAITAAGNEPMRAILATERQMFSDNWAGITSRLDVAFSTGHCNPLNWNTAFSVFGWSDAIAELEYERVRCDPLSGLPLVGGANALIWAGRAEEALSWTRGFLAEREFNPWVDDMRFAALMASGQHADSPGFFGPTPQGSAYRFPRALWAHALTGNVMQARAIYDESLVAKNFDAFIRIAALAAMGDRDGANELAARVDERTGGVLVLLLSTQNCYCGAPFDLEATPVFRARIEEAGLPWPPPSPIQYPAKDW